jgi:hypothetical protein
MGRTNMTIETIADMIWALGCKIAVKISDASDAQTNHPIEEALEEPEIKVHEAKPSSGSVDLTKPKAYELAI